jgi:molybdate transport system substrate-binding protein
MGITEQMKRKTKHPPSGGFSGSLLITGEADIAINSKPELLSVPGVEVVGPLPGDMAFTVIYDAGVQTGAAQADAAKALVKYLMSPEAQAVFKAKGFDPA